MWACFGRENFQSKDGKNKDEATEFGHCLILEVIDLDVDVFGAIYWCRLLIITTKDRYVALEDIFLWKILE